MHSGSWLVLALLVASCGGRSQEPAPEAARGDGGTAGSGGTAGGGGASGSGGAPVCEGFTPGCLLNCATMSGFQARCVDGQWSCLDGVLYEDCPSDSCSMDWGECCNRATGHLSGATCGDDGKRLPCDDPGAERIPNKAACIPDSLDVVDCNELDGQACGTPDLECYNSGGCRLSCRCIGGEGGLVWACIIPVC